MRLVAAAKLKTLVKEWCAEHDQDFADWNPGTVDSMLFSSFLDEVDSGKTAFVAEYLEMLAKYEPEKIISRLNTLLKEF